MKRTITLILVLCLLAAGLSGCGAHEARGGAVPSVVAAIFPIWDWSRNLLGENPENMRLTLLLDNGTDMHSYQPSVEDVTAIATCDLFIYVGGESDAWVEDALNNAVNPNLVALNLMDVLGGAGAAKAEEAVEGMQESGEDEDAYDEHIWLSLRNARICCEAIADALARIDPDHGDAYAANAAAYAERLDALDAEYRAAAVYALAKSDRIHDTLLFADRFPFRYLLDDYHIRYYAAFSGCEAEAEAGFETVMFLAGKVDERGLPAVLTTESPVPRLAETVIENTARKDAVVLALDSMQSVTAADAEGGETYLGVMERNLEVLKEAL